MKYHKKGAMIVIKKNGVIILFVFMFILSSCSQLERTVQPALDSHYQKINVKVERVVDGDTIKVTLNGKKASIRFLLVDTPESVKSNTKVQPWGKESSDYTKKLLTGKTVELELQDKLDKYGRGLAYVYLDGKSIQEDLLLHGLARVAYVYTKNPPHLKEFEVDEAKAKENKLNIWSVSGYVQDNGFHPEVVRK